MIPFKDESGKYHLEMVAPLAGADGYGSSAELLCIELDRMGHDIRFIRFDWQDDRFTDSALWPLEDKRGDYEVRVVYFLPYALRRFKTHYTVSMTMFETNRIPTIWAQLINQNADSCLVPSEFCRESFVGSGVQVPTAWFPLGVNTSLYKYVERDPERLPFRFLMTGLLHYRKNAGAVYRAFVEEFHPTEPVRLIFKTRRGFFDLDGATINDKRVVVVNEDFTREEMLLYYSLADCLVAPSLGEASGLCPREGMATGLPVILSDWGGLTEISDPAHSYPVPIHSLQAAPDVCSSYNGSITAGQNIGSWAKVEIGDLRRAMREVYENRIESLERGRKARQLIETDYSARRSAELFLSALSSVKQ